MDVEGNVHGAGDVRELPHGGIYTSCFKVRDVGGRNAETPRKLSLTELRFQAGASYLLPDDLSRDLGRMCPGHA
jgi:hypothetical protein